MLRLSAAGSPAGLDLPLIQHKEGTGTTCWTVLLFISYRDSQRKLCSGLSEDVRMPSLQACWGKPVCAGSSWPNVEWWWPTRSSSGARCRPRRGWTAAAPTTTSSTWWPIRWELTGGSESSWRGKFLHFVLSWLWDKCVFLCIHLRWFH